MNVQQVIDRVRSIAGDSSALQFTDTHIVDWINDGIRECAVDNNLLQKRGAQNSVSGQSDYNLPDDILKIHSVMFNNEKLQHMTLEEFDRWFRGVGSNTTGTKGTPTVSYVWAGKLTLYPAPDSVKVITINYLYTPALHTSGALGVELNLPVGYHSRIVDYCLAQVKQQDDDLQGYATKMQEFRTGIQNLKDQPESNEDLYPSISISERDSGEGGWDIYG